MGTINVRPVTTQKELNNFTKHLLRDIHALERMLEEGWFNEDPIHIGAEQEICIVDKHYKPASKSLEILERINDERFTTELAQFNIEANLDPLEFTGGCLSTLEQDLDALMKHVRKVGEELGVDFVLTGILPTIRKFDIDDDNMTPLERYAALVKAISRLRGKMYELRIAGIDELHIKHDSALIEASNTSFQVHLQIKPQEFVKMYNIAQVLTAPVLAISSNSPMLFGKRLWHETRIALFQQSIDTRVTSEHIRDRSPRVTFGNKWLRDSIAEMYKEDIVRFRVMLTTDFEDDAILQLDNGISPKLRALTVHNSTVYRWNRPCYGISPNGKPHLRIENRVLPAGPSIPDEVANAAFWLGLMESFGQEFDDITNWIEFDHAKENFISAARSGIDTAFTWLNGAKVGACDLIKEELLPMARKGLAHRKVNAADIDRYMGIIEERSARKKTGTQWLLDSQLKLMKQTSREEVSFALTASMIENQKNGLPVHQWAPATLENPTAWNPHTVLVEEFMTTDVFTVHGDDIPELAADIMNWRKVKNMPVEDEKGRLIGLITYRILLNYFTGRDCVDEDKANLTLKQIMLKDPPVVNPEATIIEAMMKMKEYQTDCLPVVKNKKLIGIITEGNFLSITNSLLNRIAKGDRVVKDE